MNRTPTNFWNDKKKRSLFFYFDKCYGFKKVEWWYSVKIITPQFFFFFTSRTINLSSTNTISKGALFVLTLLFTWNRKFCAFVRFGNSGWRDEKGCGGKKNLKARLQGVKVNEKTLEGTGKPILNWKPGYLHYLHCLRSSLLLTSQRFGHCMLRPSTGSVSISEMRYCNYLHCLHGRPHLCCQIRNVSTVVHPSLVQVIYVGNNGFNLKFQQISSEENCSVWWRLGQQSKQHK